MRFFPFAALLALASIVSAIPDFPSGLSDDDMARLNAMYTAEVDGPSPVPQGLDEYSPAEPSVAADDEALKYIDTFLHSQVTVQFDLGDRLDFIDLPPPASHHHASDGSSPAPAPGDDSADGILYKSFEEAVGQQRFKAHLVIARSPSTLHLYAPTGQSPAPAAPLRASSRGCSLALTLGIASTTQQHSVQGTFITRGLTLHRSRTEKGRRRVALGIDRARAKAAVGYPEQVDLFDPLPADIANSPASSDAAVAAAAAAHAGGATTSATASPISPAVAAGASREQKQGTPRFAELFTGEGWLVRNGQSFIETAIPVEGLDEAAAAQRGPRGAVGFDKQGHLMILVVEGSRSRGEGLDLYEFTDALVRLNFHQAINVGGDGGRALIVRGSAVNSPRCKRGKGDPQCMERDDALLCLRGT